MATAHTDLALYRFYAADDTLLYVGLTINPGRRFERHRTDKSWWTDVARVTLEQHPTLEALRAAERAAIEAEHPLHNIRMNGGKTHVEPLPFDADPATAGLVGRCFHTWRPASDDDKEHGTIRNGRVLEWQGRILERIDYDVYLIETYSWWDGTPEQKLHRISDMTDWTLYSNNIEMIAALGCREPREHGKPGHCGNDAEYLTSTFLGSNGVCDHCAGYYGKVRPIVWRDGKASLGPETTVPHPLSPEGLMRR